MTVDRRAKAHMDIQAIIDELEKQAAHYRAAANSLRSLGTRQVNGAQMKEIPATPPTQTGLGKVRQGKKPVQSKPAQATQSNAARPKATLTQQSASKTSASPKRTMSPEARAKLSALMKARHQQRKNEAS
jgi:hypothetical protein